MSSSIRFTDPHRPLLIRVKRRADEEPTVPNKRLKFVATSDSPNEDRIRQLVSRSCPTLPPPNSRPEAELKIRDYEDWSVKQNKTRDVITVNGQPLVSAPEVTADSLDYIYLYDIYLYDDNQVFDFDDEYEESDEDPDDENYAYNDYPDEDEVSEEALNYYEYKDDQTYSDTDLNQQFSRSNIDSDVNNEESGEDEDPLKSYLKRAGYSAEGNDANELKKDREDDSDTDSDYF